MVSEWLQKAINRGGEELEAHTLQDRRISPAKWGHKSPRTKNNRQLNLDWKADSSPTTENSFQRFAVKHLNETKHSS